MDEDLSVFQFTLSEEEMAVLSGISSAPSQHSAPQLATAATRASSLSPVLPQPASTFYVSLNGSDGNTGGKADPFASLSKCVSAATEGARCMFVGGGRFEVSETVELPRGITLAGDAGDDGKGGAAGLPVLDGSSRLNTTWTRSKTSSCLYISSPLNEPVAQLWTNNAKVRLYGEREEKNTVRGEAIIQEIQHTGGNERYGS